MKTMKILFGVMMAFSTMFLFDRCTESGQKSEGDDTVKTEATGSSERAANDTTNNAEGCSIPDGACDNTARYGTQVDGGGMEIAPSVGKELVKGFYEGHDPKIIKGAFISKEALDAIFCNNPGYNGLYCYIANNPDGGETMVIEGWRDEEGGNTRTKVQFNSAIPPADRYKVFMTQTLCPMVCGSCGTW
jgi:hypothetical protein